MQEQQWPSAPPTSSRPPSGADLSVELYTEPLEDPVLDEALQELKSGALIAQQDSEPEEAGEGEDPARVVRRRATYSREHKLAAIHYATKTWKTDHSGTKVIGRQEAAKILHLSWAVLWQWMAAAADIEAMPTGSLKNRKKGRRVNSTNPLLNGRYSNVENSPMYLVLHLLVLQNPIARLREK
jgi:hypothetical protein